MLGIGFGEFALIVLVLIIVLGPERLPSFMKSVGKGIRTMRQASRDIRTAVGIDEMMREEVVYRPPPVRKPEPPKGALPVSRGALEEGPVATHGIEQTAAENAVPALPMVEPSGVSPTPAVTAASESESTASAVAPPKDVKES